MNTRALVLNNHFGKFSNKETLSSIFCSLRRKACVANLLSVWTSLCFLGNSPDCEGQFLMLDLQDLWLICNKFSQSKLVLINKALLSVLYTLFFLHTCNFGCIFPQISTSAGKWTDCRVYCSKIFLGQIQNETQVPSPSLLTGKYCW